MSESKSRLRLGPLPRNEIVKLSVSLTVSLKEELDRYASEFSQLHAPVDAATLIPHMLQAFIASDRGYRMRRASAKKASRRAGASMEQTSAPGRASEESSSS